MCVYVCVSSFAVNLLQAGLVVGILLQALLGNDRVFPIPRDSNTVIRDDDVRS